MIYINCYAKINSFNKQAKRLNILELQSNKANRGMAAEKTCHNS